MGSINTDSTTINFTGANIKIATLGKGLIFADGTTLSSNTQIDGGGSATFQDVTDLGNVSSNTLLLTNQDTTIVSSGNIESNIVTTIIRFQHGSELPDGQGITLENASNNGNVISNVVQFSNGFVIGSNLVANEFASNVLEVTGRIGASFFLGDGGLLSNISGGGNGDVVYCSVGGLSGTQTLSGTTENRVIITATFENSDPVNHFTLSSGFLTIKVAGTYSLSYNTLTNVTAGSSESGSYAYIHVNDSTPILRSRVYMYNRTYGRGYNSGASSFIHTFAAGDTVCIMARKYGGSSTVVVDMWRTQISMYKIA
jgi:hypothetical protein